MKFQKQWFIKFPWLHFNISLGSVLCHICMVAKSKKITDLTKCNKDAFTSKGYSNWKKAMEKFSAHEKSNYHRLAASNLKYVKTEAPVISKINIGYLKEQEEAREALLKLISSMKFLGEQGLAIRGNESSHGNFVNLLELRSEDSKNLQTWLHRKKNFTSPVIQNELLEIMSYRKLRYICKNINSFSHKFGAIIDRT